MSHEISTNRPAKTQLLTKGALRYLRQAGYAVICELRLNNNRRVDIMGIDRKGKILIVEVKSGPEDYHADDKWRDYLPYCDRFLFAIGQDFPVALIPDEIGVMIADGYFADIVRDGALGVVNGGRRKAILLAFARKSANRLYRLDAQA